MTIEENMSAGLGKCVGKEKGLDPSVKKNHVSGCAAIVFFLGATRTIHIVGSYTPVAVVRGEWLHLWQFHSFQLLN